VPAKAAAVRTCMYVSALGLASRHEYMLYDGTSRCKTLEAQVLFDQRCVKMAA
jgi:hypothetical protein